MVYRQINGGKLISMLGFQALGDAQRRLTFESDCDHPSSQHRDGFWSGEMSRFGASHGCDWEPRLAPKRLTIRFYLIESPSRRCHPAINLPLINLPALTREPKSDFAFRPTRYFGNPSSVCLGSLSTIKRTWFSPGSISQFKPEVR